MAPSYALPIFLSGDYIKRSFGATLGGAYQFNDLWAFGGELSYATGHHLGGKYTDHDFDSPKDGSNETITFTSEAKLYWFGMSPYVRIGRWIESEEVLYRPYFQFGAGLYQVWYKEGFTTLEGRTSKNVKLTNQKILQRGIVDTNVGLNFGIGVDQRVTDRLGVGIDLRYHHIYKAVDQDLDGADDDSLTFFVPSLRFFYLF